MLKHKLLLFGSIFFWIYSFCQPSIQDSILSGAVSYNSYKLYARLIGPGSLLFNGSEYTATYPGIIGQPFYGKDSLQNASLSYNHILYYNIPMGFDLVANEIVVKLDSFTIKLNKNKIDSLYINEHLFVFYSSDSILGEKLGPDIYNLLYNGNTKVYVKMKKQIERPFRAEDLSHFRQYNYYYILKNGVFHVVDNKKYLFNLFKNHKAEIRDNWRKYNLNYKKDPEKAILETVRYYDHL